MARTPVMVDGLIVNVLVTRGSPDEHSLGEARYLARKELVVRGLGWPGVGVLPQVVCLEACVSSSLIEDQDTGSGR